MRATVVAALGVSTLALAACMPRVSYEGHEVSSLGSAPLKAAAALDCPDRQGALTRTGRAPDGRSCDYAGPAGETVRLSLVALDGRTPVEALATTRAELKGLVPIPVRAAPAVARDEPGDHTDVDLPFFHVHTVGDRADVKIFGLKVHADGDDAEVRHDRKHMVVHAGPRGAEVSVEDVGGANAELVYVLAAEKGAPSGYAAVGYVAKGPAEGPLVVGEFRATRRQQSHGGRGGHDDIDRLIERNLRG